MNVPSDRALPDGPFPGDRVVVLIHVLARGHLSGVELDRETAHVWSVADDRVTKCQVYFDRSEALDEVIDA